MTNVSEFGYLRESEDGLHNKISTVDHPLAQELREASKATASEDSAAALPGSITCLASRGVVGSVIGSPAYYPALGNRAEQLLCLLIINDCVSQASG